MSIFAKCRVFHHIRTVPCFLSFCTIQYFTFSIENIFDLVTNVHVNTYFCRWPTWEHHWNTQVPRGQPSNEAPAMCGRHQSGAGEKLLCCRRRVELWKLSCARCGTWAWTPGGGQTSLRSTTLSSNSDPNP